MCILLIIFYILKLLNFLSQPLQSDWLRFFHFALVVTMFRESRSRFRCLGSKTMSFTFAFAFESSDDEDRKLNLSTSFTARLPGPFTTELNSLLFGPSCTISRAGILTMFPFLAFFRLMTFFKVNG